MVGRINAPYNVIFSRLILNKLCVILSLRYLMMKFKIENGIAYVKGDHVEAKKKCMLITKLAMKQSKMMILETLEERNRQKERKAKPIRESVKTKLEDPEKITMVDVELIGVEVVRVTELLKENKSEFT